MIELPEARTLARQLRKEILRKEIVDVGGNFTDHKFTFYYGNPVEYASLLVGKKVTEIRDRNYYVEIIMEDCALLFRDGANLRFYDNREDFKEKSKLCIVFKDGSFLNVTTSMYSAIAVFKIKEGYDNLYYQMELERIGATDQEFTFDYFCSLIDDKTEKLSSKAFLATEQRILGIGNGVVQDILFSAALHPKRKMNTLTELELKDLYEATKMVLQCMVEKGGRDTEKDLYGQAGGYSTILSNKTYKKGCPKCHGEIKKEQFLGGSIYYCPTCQK